MLKYRQQPAYTIRHHSGDSPKSTHRAAHLQQCTHNQPQPTTRRRHLPHAAPQHTTNTISPHQLLNGYRTGKRAAEDWSPPATPPPRPTVTSAPRRPPPAPLQRHGTTPPAPRLQPNVGHDHWKPHGQRTGE